MDFIIEQVFFFSFFCNSSPTCRGRRILAIYSVKYLTAGHALRKRLPCNPPNAYCKELDHVAN